MSNDISTSTGTAAPPSSEPTAIPAQPGEMSRHGPMPSSTPKTSIADLTVMAEGDDITDTYAAQRAEDEGRTNQDASPAQRNFNRHQRKNAALQHKEREIAELKAQLESPRAADGTPDDVGQWVDEIRGSIAAEGEQAQNEQQNGEQTDEQAETREQMLERTIEQVKRERDYEIKVHDHKKRLDDLRQIEPNIDAYLAAGAQMPLTDHLEMTILEDPNSALVQAYLVHPNNQGHYHALLQMSERDAERAIARISTLAAIRTQQYLAGQHGAPRSQQPQRRVATQALKPITPLRGGASASTPLDKLAERDGDVTAYANARARQKR